MITPNSFADSTVVDMNGLDMERAPEEVLSIAGAFLKTKVDASNLPTD
jgi:hypothetical protein